MEKVETKSVDEYIAQYPKDIQKKLNDLRAAIRAAAPEAKEKISYGMPAYWLEGNLVYFGAHKEHIGFYPTASGIEKFKDELEGYTWSKGAVQFPLDKPLPLKLVERIVKYRVSENQGKRKAKTATKKP